MQSSYWTPEDAGRPAPRLITVERTRAPRAEPRAPTASDEIAELTALREQLVDANTQLAETSARLEEATEEVAFHREQLRSTTAFHDHLLQLERARHRLARRMIARDLAAVIAGLTRDAHVPAAEAGDGAGGTDVMQRARSSDHVGTS